MMLFSDALFERHDTGRHPESAGRIRALLAMLERSGATARCQTGALRAATQQELQRVHPADYVETVRKFAAAGGGRLDPDTVVCPQSYHVALYAAGTACAAVDAVMRDQSTTALCLVRPPGHHALASKAMGFCLFNNIAVATRQAQQVHGVERVLIVDWDVHHGNGTQDIFYEDPTVTYYSIHRYPFYPGTGNADENGAGPGRGYTVNAPVQFGTSRDEYFKIFERNLHAAAKKATPQLILISTGFDAHRLDPIGSLGLETEDFSRLTELVADVARTWSGGKIVSLLEGGYHLDALAESAEQHIEGLLQHEATVSR